MSKRTTTDKKVSLSSHTITLTLPFVYVQACTNNQVNPVVTPHKRAPKLMMRGRSLINNQISKRNKTKTNWIKRKAKSRTSRTTWSPKVKSTLRTASSRSPSRTRSTTRKWLTKNQWARLASLRDTPTKTCRKRIWRSITKVR